MKTVSSVPAASATRAPDNDILLNGFLPSSPGMTLPPELLLQIFEYLPLPDLTVCSQVCLYWHEVSQNTHLWKNLAQKEWKLWAEGNSENEDDDEKDWQQIYRKRYLQDRTLPKLLKEMVCDETRHQATSKITQYGLEVFEGLEKLMEKLYRDQPDYVPRDPWPPYPVARHIDVLYRANNVHEILYTKCYVPSWKRLRETEDATMEDGAILLSEWGTRQCGAQIREHLDLLATSFIRQQLASEGLKSKDSCSLKSLRGGAFASILQARSRSSVLVDLLQFLTTDVGLKGARQDYYNPSNSFLHSVLENKRGIPISLSVIYSSVAARLGIELQPLNTPGHFLLLYDGSQFLEQSLVIDVFNGRVLTFEELDSFFGSEHYTMNTLPRAAPWEVWYRMLGNLRHIYKSSLDNRLSAVLAFMLQLQENQNDYFLSIFMYKTRGFVKEALNDLERVKALAEEIDPTTVRRLEEHINEEREATNEIRSRQDESYQCVKYAVGTVFRHAKYGYRGVIFRWDPSCISTPEWIAQMGVNRLPRGTQQPFYSVRVDDRDRPSQITYVAEDNIGPLSEDMIQSPDLGMYFESYDETTHTYIPNEGLKRQFPCG